MKNNTINTQIVIFKVGPVVCCVDAFLVESIVHPQPIHIFPHQAEFILGVIQYQDSAVSVVNLYQKFNLLTPESKDESRYIMGHTENGTVGFWVDEVLEVTSEYEIHNAKTPAYTDKNVFECAFLWRDKLILKTDFDKLFAMNDAAPLQEWIQNDGGNAIAINYPNTPIEETDITAWNDVGDDESDEKIQALMSRGTEFSQLGSLEVSQFSESVSSFEKIDPKLEIEEAEMTVSPLTQLTEFTVIEESIKPEAKIDVIDNDTQASDEEDEILNSIEGQFGDSHHKLVLEPYEDVSNYEKSEIESEIEFKNSAQESMVFSEKSKQIDNHSELDSTESALAESMTMTKFNETKALKDITGVIDESSPQIDQTSKIEASSDSTVVADIEDTGDKNEVVDMVKIENISENSSTATENQPTQEDERYTVKSLAEQYGDETSQVIAPPLQDNAQNKIKQTQPDIYITPTSPIDSSYMPKVTNNTKVVSDTVVHNETGAQNQSDALAMSFINLDLKESKSLSEVDLEDQAFTKPLSAGSVTESTVSIMQPSSQMPDEDFYAEVLEKQAQENEHLSSFGLTEIDANLSSGIQSDTEHMVEEEVADFNQDSVVGNYDETVIVDDNVREFKFDVKNYFENNFKKKMDVYHNAELDEPEFETEKSEDKKIIGNLNLVSEKKDNDKLLNISEIEGGNLPSSVFEDLPLDLSEISEINITSHLSELEDEREKFLVQEKALNLLCEFNIRKKKGDVLRPLVFLRVFWLLLLLFFLFRING